MSQDFDTFLESALKKEFDSVTGQFGRPELARYSQIQGGSSMKRLFTSKLSLGLAVGGLLLGATGAAASTAVTGSTNPAVWGQQVKAAVGDCKAQAKAAGKPGIGDCVSAFAKRHGDTVSDQHGNNQNQKTKGGNVNGKADSKGKKNNSTHVNASPEPSSSNGSSHSSGKSPSRP
jgi:hypothetical protein